MFGHPSLQRRTKKESPQILPKITIFLVFLNKTQILLFALFVDTTEESASVASYNCSGALQRPL